MTYLKGKDIKVQGDCLVNCFIKRIEMVVSGVQTHTDGYDVWASGLLWAKKPEGFQKW